MRLFATLLLALGLLAPFAATTAAAPVPQGPAADAGAAPRDDAPPAFPAPDRVVVVGDFQAAFGCAGWDKECGATELQDDGTGVWSALLPLPAGSWPFRIVTRGDIDRSLGRDADPDGQDLLVDVPEGTFGVFFSYNHPQGLIVAAPVVSDIQVDSGVGQIASATPAPEGGHEAFFQLPAGQYFFTAFVNGAPAGSIEALLEEDGIARVLVDDGGNILGVEFRIESMLSVAKLDESGAPVPGSCFSVYDGAGLVAQACDGDDRSDDGTTEIRFPRGVDEGSYILAESRTPDGVAAADDQEVYLQRGDVFANAVIAGGGGGGGGEGQTWSVYLYPVDEGGSSIFGACLALDGYGELCDDGSGTIVFTGVADGSYTVSETLTPDGYNPADPVTIEVAGGDTQAAVPHTAMSAATYNIYIQTLDEGGNPVFGACFVIEGQPEQCEDGTGWFTFAGMPNGVYTITETRAPEGYIAVEPFQVEVAGADAVAYPSHVEMTEAVWTLTLFAQDEAENPLFGACYSIEGYGQVCDDGSGAVVFLGLPNGTYQVVEDQAPDGFANVGAFDVTVADGDLQVAVRHAATTQGGDTGTLVVYAFDDADNLLPGACYRIRPLADSDGVDTELCDDADGQLDGVTHFETQAIGSYRLVETLTPDGWEQAERQNVDVLPGELTEVRIDHVSSASVLSDGATVVFAVVDGDGFGIAGACVAVDGALAIEVCDNGEGDEDLAEGLIQISGFPVGAATARNTFVPDGYELAADTPFEVLDVAEPLTVILAPAAQAQTATLRIVTQDEAANPVGGACYTVDGAEPVCDDGSGALVLADVRAGEPAVVVEMTAAPAGFATADRQELVLEAGADAELVFQVAAAPGELWIYTRDEGNAPLAGACYALNDGAPVCDNGDGDSDPAEGNVLLAGVQPGLSTVAQTTAPAGYDPAAAQEVTVEAGAAASVAFTNVLSGPLTGRIYVVTRDGADNDLEGACYLLVDASGAEFGPYCDQGEGDTDEDPGQMRVTDIPVGAYDVRQVTPPAGYSPAESQPIEVIAGEAARAVFIVAEAGGLVVVSVQDAGGASLADFCVTIGDLGQICDAGAGEVSVSLPVGPALLTLDTPPAGYVAREGGTAEVAVEDGQTSLVAFVVDPATGSITVSFTWEGDAPAAPLCVLVDGATQYCDNDGSDTDPTVGLLVISGLAPGIHSVGLVVPQGGFQTAEDQQVDVPAGGTQSIAFALAAMPTEVPTEVATEAAPAGWLAIAVTYDGDLPEAGGCFALGGPMDAGPICDNGVGDASTAAHLIVIEGLAPGIYTVTQTSAPEGYSAAAPMEVEVVDGEQASLELANSGAEAAIGSIQAMVADEGDSPVGGSCVTVGDIEVCDNGVGDGDPTPGQILVGGVIAGSYEIDMTGTPDGFITPDPVSVEVGADGPAPAAFILAEAPVETGSLELTLEDSDGNLTPGACVLLSGGPEGDTALVVCDDATAAGAGGMAAMRLQPAGIDADPRPGIILIEGLPVGVYEVLQGEPGGTPDDPALFEAAEVPSRTVTVIANTVVQVIIIIIVIPAEVGDIVIVKLDDQNQLLGGACFTFYGPDPILPLEVCDNAAEDSNGTAGIIRVNGLENGDYTLSETLVPAGYEPALDQLVTVNGTVAIVEIVNVPMENPVGTLTVHKLDGNGDPLAGACFQIVVPATTTVIAGPICDRNSGTYADGAADGEIFFADVMAGTWNLVETQTPSTDYYSVSPQSVTIVAGADSDMDVVNVLKPGRVQIAKVDGDGGYLDGACFLLDGGADYEVCDNLAGDGNLAVGIIRFTNVPAGDYTLVETQAPLGYAPAADQPISVSPNRTTFITVTNDPETPPTDVGTLVVYKVGPNGLPLAGACFSLKVGAVTRVPTTCDGADGLNDGTIVFEDVPVGTYTLRETVKPSADYQQASDRPVEVFTDEITEITVVNDYKTGRVLVLKVDQWGNPIEGACFDLSPDGKGPRCSNWAGEILFDNLEPGVYKLRETLVPAGYEQAPDKTGIVVQPGLTTTITVVNKAGPPPSGHGSIRVIKFFCVAGKGGAMTLFYDSSDGAPNPIDKTAGCTKGDASFVAVKSGGSGDSLTFRTGSDGEAQRFLVAGTWTLTEDATGESEGFRVYEGQQTTIVVINYIVPPPPAPATIVITKYTCDPGFGGTYWADFQAACSDDAQLTNNVTVRIAGDQTAARVTGDGGETGQTAFTNLAAGSYKVSEDKPAGAGTYYLFCGVNPSAPDYKAVEQGIWFTLKSGETTYCTFYNVPDDLSDSRGAITVYKYVCDATDYPAGFDYEAECSPLTTGVKFGISVWNGTAWTPRTSAITNEDGIVRFSQLQPGTYQLKEIGGEWCHAESDNVNANGDLIVRAGQRTTVWIYNCVPPRQGPNTGTGPGLVWSTPTPPQIAPAEATGGAVGLALAWPALAIGGLAWRRRRAA